jgi:hypothetical protein
VARHHYRDLARRIEESVDGGSVDAVEQDLTRRLLVALKEAAEAGGGRLVILAVPLPGTCDYYDETRDLLDYMDELGAHFVDVSPALRAGAARGLSINYPGDLHWTADGHRLVGLALYEYLTASESVRR